MRINNQTKRTTKIKNQFMETKSVTLFTIGRVKQAQLCIIRKNVLPSRTIRHKNDNENSKNRSQIDAREQNSLSKTKDLFKHHSVILSLHFKKHLKKVTLYNFSISAPLAIPA